MTRYTWATVLRLKGLSSLPVLLLSEWNIKRQIRHWLLEADFLLLKRFQTLGLLYLHASVLSTPVVIGLLTNPRLSCWLPQ